MTSSLFIVLAALFGMISVILGAFGAHYLQDKWTVESLKSFETGVRYQLFHAILLLVLGFQWNFESSLEKIIGIGLSIGIILFSFSIYGLCYSSNRGKKWKILGPITPLGGLLLILAWLGIIVQVIHH